ncbi:hypothetical protein A6A40_21095 (plasmid) [Azospirillum humicireducens]|uniref:Plasmid maintenance system killer protein n=1 Tax=Azospirillum humicireducens TaxID=1226968 RepID=A0A2R4VSU3_9PROT|nr:hypothetical protein A6A40_21095 [Azospirillum humicireducens]
MSAKRSRSVLKARCFYLSHSIRINDQWRIVFVWRDGGAHEVEIVDYH